MEDLKEVSDTSHSESSKIWPPKLLAKEKAILYNSLAGLVKALEGKYTTIDLRNECCVTGKVVTVDAYMNVEMEDAIFYNSRGKEHVFPSFFLKERNIRYVHIPDMIPIQKLLQMQHQKMRFPRRDTSRRKPTFKSVRAKRYNKQIVNSAYQTK